MLIIIVTGGSLLAHILLPHHHHDTHVCFFACQDGGCESETPCGEDSHDHKPVPGCSNLQEFFIKLTSSEERSAVCSLPPFSDLFISPGDCRVEPHLTENIFFRPIPFRIIPYIREATPSSGLRAPPVFLS